MKDPHKRRRLVSSWLLSATALGVAIPAHAQAEAVTQFAPLEDSPIPTPPAQHSTTPPSYSSVPSNTAPTPTTTDSSTFTADNNVNLETPSPSPAVARPQSPTVGSSWLGAPTPIAAEPPPRVVDSGLPVFTKASPTPNRDVVKDDKAAEEDETHRVALTFSLARALLLPVVVPGEVKNAALYEGTIELKVFERLSLAVLGGVGGFDIPLSQLGENVHVTGKELGGQARIYVLGDFDHGLSIGGEYMRVWAEADPIDVEAVPPPPLPSGTGTLTGEATLTGLGAFIGYKFTASFGLTFDTKLGVQKLTADGEGTVSGEIGPGYPTLTESETFRYEQLVPLVNVNVGWAI